MIFESDSSDESFVPSDSIDSAQSNQKVLINSFSSNNISFNSVGGNFDANKFVKYLIQKYPFLKKLEKENFNKKIGSSKSQKCLLATEIQNYASKIEKKYLIFNSYNKFASTILDNNRKREKYGLRGFIAIISYFGLVGSKTNFDDKFYSDGTLANLLKFFIEFESQLHLEFGTRANHLNTIKSYLSFEGDRINLTGEQLVNFKIGFQYLNTNAKVLRKQKKTKKLDSYQDLIEKGKMLTPEQEFSSIQSAIEVLKYVVAQDLLNISL